MSAVYLHDATTDDPQTAADHTASAAVRQLCGSCAAAGLQRGCSDLHCTKPIVDSGLSKAESEVIHGPAG
jgi:hypothetical protein